MSDEPTELHPQNDSGSDVMTVRDLMVLLQTYDPPGESLVLLSEWDEHAQDFKRVPVKAAEFRGGWNAPPVLVLTSDDPEHALE